MSELPITFWYLMAGIVAAFVVFMAGLAIMERKKFPTKTKRRFPRLKKI
jgi:hypothetical protein